jgi:hypothetical protein
MSNFNRLDRPQRIQRALRRNCSRGADRLPAQGLVAVAVREIFDSSFVGQGGSAASSLTFFMVSAAWNVRYRFWRNLTCRLPAFNDYARSLVGCRINRQTGAPAHRLTGQRAIDTPFSCC